MDSPWDNLREIVKTFTCGETGTGIQQNRMNAVRGGILQSFERSRGNYMYKDY